VPALSRLPGVRRLPQVLGPVLDDVVLFDSWRGQFSDNPRAISEEIHRRGADLRQVWVLGDAAAAYAPDWVERVAPGSRAHLTMLGRARYLVANTTVPGFHHKRSGTRFLETWHGTPLKRIGVHVKRDRSAVDRQATKTLEANVRNWDVLLSPNRFSTPIFRAAFKFEGEIAEIGYPRTDLLLAPEAGEIRSRTRASLGVGESQQAVLFAPTFRDREGFPFDAEVERLARGLGDSHVLLLRTHAVDAKGRKPADSAHYRDVSTYQDNRELFLAADVLVTDYSSLMFDFAVTRKPILFYTPDLAVYRDEVRGFYFDFEAEAPGPLVEEIDALVDAIENVQSTSAQYQAAYARFAERFCHLDDGHAAPRAVDVLLS
jgi:CDP-glycerol glycerophosphotransferase